VSAKSPHETETKSYRKRSGRVLDKEARISSRMEACTVNMSRLRTPVQSSGTQKLLILALINDVPGQLSDRRIVERQR